MKYFNYRFLTSVIEYTADADKKNSDHFDQFYDHLPID